METVAEPPLTSDSTRGRAPVPERPFHEAGGGGGGDVHRARGAECALEGGLNPRQQLLHALAAMSDHRAGLCGEHVVGDFGGTRKEEIAERCHDGALVWGLEDEAVR